jgi:hypothetical protein
MKQPYRPYDDGIHDKATRARLRHEAWANPDRKPRLRATETLCNECRLWVKVSDPETWCEHFQARYGEPPREVDAPKPFIFKPHYNPNIQPGGAWIRSRAQEKLAMKVCGKQPKH